MPWTVMENHGDCSGWAVVKDSDGSIAGCHETQAEAEDQLTALNIAESDDSEDRSKPMNDNLLKRLLKGLERLIFEVEDEITQDRAMSIERIYDQVWQGLMTHSEYVYLHGIYREDAGSLYAVVNIDGVLMRSDITIADDEVLLGQFVRVSEEYWHGHPRFEPLTERQKKQQARDRSQDKYLRTCGYIVERIWENEMSKKRVRQVLSKYDII